MNFCKSNPKIRVWERPDESWFTGDGIAQKKNAYYWALTRDAVKPVRFQKHPTKVHVWAAISVRGIIGPYFFHADGKNISVNQYTYIRHVLSGLCLNLKSEDDLSGRCLCRMGRHHDEGISATNIPWSCYWKTL